MSGRSIRLALKLQATLAALAAGHGGHSWIHTCSSVRRIYQWPPPRKRRWFITEAINQHVWPPLHTAHAPICLPCRPGYPLCDNCQRQQQQIHGWYTGQLLWAWRWTAICSAPPAKNPENSTPNTHSNRKVCDLMLNTRSSAGSNDLLVVGGSVVAADTLLFPYNSFSKWFCSICSGGNVSTDPHPSAKSARLKALCSVCMYVAHFHPRSNRQRPTALYAGPRAGWGYIPSKRNIFFITLYIVLLVVFCLFFSSAY